MTTWTTFHPVFQSLIWSTLPMIHDPDRTTAMNLEIASNLSRARARAFAAGYDEEGYTAALVDIAQDWLKRNDWADRNPPVVTEYTIPGLFWTDEQTA